MNQTENTTPTSTPAGAAIRQWLESDHARLDVLLNEGLALDGSIDRERYDEFRKGLLRHINIEEKILFPAAMKLAILERAARLRLDHGAIASLLVLDPSPTVTKALRHILDIHNKIEEGEDGIYEQCVELLGEQAGTIFSDLESSPHISLATRAQGQQLLDAAKRSLERAGYAPSLLDD